MKLLQALLFAVLTHAFGADSLSFSETPSATLASSTKQDNGDIAVTVSLPGLRNIAQASPMELFNQLQDAIGTELESKGGKRIGKVYHETDETGKVVGFVVPFAGVFYDDPSGATAVGGTTISGNFRCKDIKGTVTCELEDRKISSTVYDNAVIDSMHARSTSDPNYSFYRNKTYVHERYVHAVDLERNPAVGKIMAMTATGDILEKTGKRSEMVNVHDDMTISIEARARSMDVLQRAAFYRDCIDYSIDHIEQGDVFGDNIPGLKGKKTLGKKTLSDIRGLSDEDLLKLAYDSVLEKESGGNINSLRGICYTYADALKDRFPFEKLKEIFLKDGKLLVSGISEIMPGGRPGDYDLSFPGLPKLMDGYRALSEADRNFNSTLKKGDKLVNNIAKQYMEKTGEKIDFQYNAKSKHKISLRKVPTTLIESLEIGYEIRRDILKEMKKVNDEESLLKTIQRDPEDPNSGRLQDLNDELALLQSENKNLASEFTEDKMKELLTEFNNRKVGLLNLYNGSIYVQDMNNRSEIIKIATEWREKYRGKVKEKLYPKFIQDIFAELDKMQLVQPGFY